MCVKSVCALIFVTLLVAPTRAAADGGTADAGPSPGDAGLDGGAPLGSPTTPAPVLPPAEPMPESDVRSRAESREDDEGACRCVRARPTTSSAALGAALFVLARGARRRARIKSG